MSDLPPTCVTPTCAPCAGTEGIRRVTLQPGEKRTVVFDIRPAALAFYSIDMKCVVEPGPFTIYAGPDSVQLKSVKLLVS